jgi:hypothetical protein
LHVKRYPTEVQCQHIAVGSVIGVNDLQNRMRERSSHLAHPAMLAVACKTDGKQVCVVTVAESPVTSQASEVWSTIKVKAKSTLSCQAFGVKRFVLRERKLLSHCSSVVL